MEHITVRALGSEGQGIATLESGKTLFAEGVLPGEECDVEVIAEKSRIAYGKVIKRYNDSPMRREPLCGSSDTCGGCALMHMNDDLQREFKENKVRDALTRIGGLDKELVENITEPIVTAEKTAFYRNHMQYSISGFKVGLKERNGSGVSSCNGCILGYPVFEKIRKVMEETLGDHPTDLFTSLITRGSERTSEYLVELVSQSSIGHEMIIRDSQSYIRTNSLFERISEVLDGGTLKGIVLQICPDKASKRRRSGKRVVLCGEDSYREVLCGKTFKIKAGAFFQVNTKQAERLYSKVAEYSGSARTVYDLFCGTGSIGICTVSPQSFLYGIEVSHEAVMSAKENAVINGMSNAVFVAKPAERSDLKDPRLPHPDVVIVDPPRKGMDPALLIKLKELSPDKLIYVSCDPATLARDLKSLLTDYEISKISVFDLFPQTEHVETVVLLSKLSSAPKLEVKISMSELDLTEAEAKATYDEIQEYVKEQTGLHVTHLNIAQIKRKHGIIERANYNLPKSENSRQPNCPPEKEKAIVAALKHFKMIK